MPESTSTETAAFGTASITLDVQLPLGIRNTLLEELQALRKFSLAHIEVLRVLTERGWKEYDTDSYTDEEGNHISRYEFVRIHVQAEDATEEVEQALDVSDGLVGLFGFDFEED
jgi:hypothetical protein